MGLRGRCTCLGLCVGLVAGVLPGVLVVLFVAAVVWVQGFVQPVLGVDEVFDEPEGGAARVEVGTVGGLGQVVDDFIGGVQQPCAMVSTSSRSSRRSSAWPGFRTIPDSGMIVILS